VGDVCAARARCWPALAAVWEERRAGGNEKRVGTLHTVRDGTVCPPVSRAYDKKSGGARAPFVLCAKLTRQ
jgi:hypothetical protein